MSEALERGVGPGREGKANLDTEKHRSQLSWGKTEETSYSGLLDNLWLALLYLNQLILS